MDQERKDRYPDTLYWIHHRSELINTWQEDLSESHTFPDTKTVLAMFKAFQEFQRLLWTI
jgi:hypothetical protein